MSERLFYMLLDFFVRLRLMALLRITMFSDIVRDNREIYFSIIAYFDSSCGVCVAKASNVAPPWETTNDGRNRWTASI